MSEERRWTDRLVSRPWNKNQLRKLGKAIVAGGSSTDALTYGDLVDWNSALIFTVLPGVRAAVAHELGAGGAAVHIASRAKTLETVRDKLIRDGHRPLQNIQDLAGIRVIADMTLDQQRAVAARVARDLRQPESAVQSLLDGGHAGYRAIHVVCRFPELGDGYLEIQVRTTLQNSWANLYDALSDRYGRGIRYGDDPQDDEARQRVQAVKGNVTFQVAQIERAKAELAKLKRSASTLAVVPTELRDDLVRLELDVESRADFLRRTMDEQEAAVCRESNEEGET